MRTFLIVGLLSLLSAPLAAQQGGGLRLDLNIPALRLNVYEGDHLVRSYPVAVGMPGHDTPTGSFTITHAQWNPWWRPPAREWAKNEKDTPPGPNNPMGRVKLFFAPYYFIHGSPEEASIGTPASHGCVRMLNRHAIELARLVHSYAAPSITEDDIDGILSNSRRTRRVGFDNTIPLVIRYDPVVVADGELRVYPDFYGYNAIHTEGVYQALLRAGYDVDDVRAEDIDALIEAAKGHDGTYTVKVAEAFDGRADVKLGVAAGR
ncbi:MAG TPA: L,D-transpeptidase [Longimicrobiaceae bacterium]|nr:L,D-transpeptidase [Longimicrobiaceae bacterium]